MHPTAVALLVAVPLALFGAASAAAQVRGMRALKARTHVPSDEFAYLQGRHRRRLAAGVVMVVIAGLIAGAYLSGLEAGADALAKPAGDGQKKQMGDDERQLVRVWLAYWIVVIVLAFGLIGIAVVDAWASRRYWRAIYQEMRDEHAAKLRRDLAVYRAQKEQGRQRPGYGGRLGDGE